MHDNEAEVRVAAVSNVNETCLKNISAAKIKDVVLKEIEQSITDSTAQFKAGAI